MEDSVLSFLKAEWKVSDTGSAQCWTSSLCERCQYFSQIIKRLQYFLNRIRDVMVSVLALSVVDCGF